MRNNSGTRYLTIGSEHFLPYLHLMIPAHILEPILKLTSHLSLSDTKIHVSLCTCVCVYLYLSLCVCVCVYMYAKIKQLKSAKCENGICTCVSVYLCMCICLHVSVSVCPCVVYQIYNLYLWHVFN